MEIRATGAKTQAKAPDIAPALHALVVVPVVSSAVLLLIAVGMAAVAIGVMSSLAGHRPRRQHRTQDRARPAQ